MSGPSDAMLELLAEIAKGTAAQSTFDGGETAEAVAYLLVCTYDANGFRLIYTRDTGHHTSGWFKNPDYERCLHLSLSPTPSELWTPSTPDLDKKLQSRILHAFFGEDVRYLWAEPPHTKAGKSRGVWHWRLFCDEHWVPMLPHGEVYSTELTEAGWKSASEAGVVIISSLTP